MRKELTVRKLISLIALILYSGCGLVQENIDEIGSTPADGTPILLGFSESASTIYVSSNQFLISWFPAKNHIHSYKLKLYNGTNCTGTLIDSITQSETSYLISSLVDGASYSLSLSASNAYGHSDDICSPNILIDKQTPSLPTFVSPSINTSTNLTSFGFSWVASDNGLSGIKSTEGYFVEFFNNGVCSGLPITDKKITNAETVYSGLVSGNSYSIRVSVTDKAGNQSSGQCSPTLVASSGGGGAPTLTDPTLAISDNVTSSSSFATTTLLDVSIGNDTPATKWCVSETQAARPLPSDPCLGGLGPDSGWYSSRPNSYTLSSGDGLKIVYLWITDGTGVSGSAILDAITLDTTPPSVFTVSGITGSSDSTVDDVLVSSLKPVVHWNPSTDAVNYSVVIRNSSDTVDVCPVQATAATSYSFSSCTLVDGVSYKAKVTAFDSAQNSITSVAFDFSVDNTGPGSFTISGVQGGTDTTNDAYLVGSTTPAVAWSSATDAVSYNVSIRNSSDTADACTPLTGEIGNSATFSSCTLVSGTNYLVQITALDANGLQKLASNNSFLFTVTNTPGAFDVTGIAASSGDSTVDTYLSSNTDPVIHFSTSGGATAYDVIIKNAVNSVECQSLDATAPPVTVSGCSLSDAVYKVEVTAKAPGGFNTDATTFPFNFTKDTTPPSSFSISGITGGTDAVADNKLTDGNEATLNWQSVSGETSFNVTLYETDGFTPKCGPVVGLAPDTTSYTFTGCVLSNGTIYKAEVIAFDVINNTRYADNTQFNFDVETGVDLVLNGSGGSTLDGVPITTCGGGDTCNSSNPYVIPDNTTKYRSITMINGAYMTAPAWTAGGPGYGNGLLPLNVIGDMSVCSNCVINMNSKGYITSVGPGTTNSGSNGASHGGEGGAGGGSAFSTYGSIKNPSELGSGGACTALGSSRFGGGAIQISVTGTLELNGTIRANGSDNGHNGSAWCGASAGGSILVSVGTFSGTGGVIQANGGNGWDSRGGAGGGRISINYNIDSYSGGVRNMDARALGGTAGNYGSNEAAAGGTVYFMQNGTDTNGHLVVSNNGLNSDYLTKILAAEDFDSIRVSNLGKLRVEGFIVNTVDLFLDLNGELQIGSGTTLNPTGSTTLTGGHLTNWGTYTPTISSIDYILENYGTLTLNPNLTILSGGYFNSGVNTLNLTSLTINGGGTLSHVANIGVTQTSWLDLSVTDLFVSAGGKIDVNYKGFENTRGPGSESSGSNGSSYGGEGGANGSPVAPYGSIKSPAHLGSGGGCDSLGSNPRHGGGYVKLNVAGTLTLNGEITANGNDQGHNGSNYCGGSSGGTVYINTSTFAGSGGIVTANGGSGWDGRGGASGGRISIYYTTDLYAGGVTNMNVQSYGGSGGNRGSDEAAAAGTIYFMQNGVDTNGHVRVTNNNVDSIHKTHFLVSEDFDSIRVSETGQLRMESVTVNALNAYLDSSGDLEIGSGTTFNPTSYNFTGGHLSNWGTFTPQISNVDFHLENYATLNLNPNLIISTGGLFETGVNTINLTSLTVNNGGTLSHVANTGPTQSRMLDLNLTDLTVSSGGDINVNYKGFEVTYGSGSQSSGDNGGSYGGEGGADSTPTAPYGSIKNPVDLGSGGACNSVGSNPPHGGGYAKITVTGTLDLSGSITSNGNSQGHNGSHYCGGSAGGTIYISANTVTGSGALISANGGSGWDGRGGGSGGRIAFNYTTDSYSGGLKNMNIQAYGGNGGNWGASHAAAAGTIYFMNTGVDTNGHLLISNNNTISNQKTHLLISEDFDTIKISAEGQLRMDGVTVNVTSTTLATNGDLQIGSGTSFNPGSYNFTGGHLTNWGTFVPTISTIDFHLENYGTLNLDSNLTIATGGLFETGINAVNLTSLTINSGGVLSHVANSTSQSSWLDLNLTDLYLNSGGSINVNYKGYESSRGPGSSTSGDNGGSFGGKGGADSSPHASYGSIKTPASIGSGGSCSIGSNPLHAGGYAKITVSNTFSLNGEISANGNAQGHNGSTYCAGSSGGSIYINAGTISGSGATITSNGGNGWDGRGGGSGGRIAIYYTTDSYSGGLRNMNVQAYGGTGGNWGSSHVGSAGTIYFMNSGIDTNGHLLIRNNSVVSNHTTDQIENLTMDSITVIESGDFVTSSGHTLGFDELYLNSGGTFSVASGKTVSPTILDLAGGTLKNFGTITTTISNINFTLNNYGTMTFDDPLNIQSGGTFNVGTNTITLGTVNIQNGGVLSHVSNSNSKTNWLDLTATNITIDSGGAIDLSEKGYSEGNGLGPGVDSGSSGSGGAYGGNGGNAQSGGIGGTAYETASTIDELGSGGGHGNNSCLGGSGGGLGLVTVTGNLVLNGSILSNGGQSDCSDYNGGGGAGGGLDLVINTLSGSTGEIRANGGSGRNRGGGGGGGRIQYSVTSDSYSGGIGALPITADGGTSNLGTNGSSGSINAL